MLSFAVRSSRTVPGTWSVRLRAVTRPRHASHAACNTRLSAVGRSPMPTVGFLLGAGPGAPARGFAARGFTARGFAARGFVVRARALPFVERPFGITFARILWCREDSVNRQSVNRRAIFTGPCARAPDLAVATTVPR